LPSSKPGPRHPDLSPARPVECHHFIFKTPRYGATQFVTGCDLTTGAGCVLPPPGPGNFYPYFTQARVGPACVWEFGNMRNGNTFGGVAQYGTVNPGTLGAFASAIRPNPNC